MKAQVIKQPSNESPEVEDALQKWRYLFDDELQQVDKFIMERADSHVALIPQIISHIISSGGKRIRPILTILSAKICGYSGDRHINLATAIEFFHTATLLHDDVVDESKLRRGVPTANNIWDNQASVLVGDYLLSKAFQIISRDESNQIQRILSDSSAIITEGEVKQLIATNDLKTNKEQYIDIIASKTSQLFVAACQVGAIIAQTSPEKEAALESFGRNLGTAFQIVDDTLDYSAQHDEFGKSIGDDFREGKVTLPVILAYQYADLEEKQFWERVIEDISAHKDGDLQTAIDLIDKYEVISQCIDIALEYAKKAEQDLDVFEDCEIKTALLEILNFSIKRLY